MNRTLYNLRRCLFKNLAKQRGKAEPTIQKLNVWIIITNDGMSVHIMTSSEQARERMEAEKQHSNGTAVSMEQERKSKESLRL